ncbi:MAG: hypothetical protein LBK47_08285 [Prevotellaceae bacterium]|jgi:hypothetical protein|nr:hypothetical protein [Prevotellaceae bacterium]
MKKIFALLIVAVCGMQLYAQPASTGMRKRVIRAENDSLREARNERMQARKVGYITMQLNLTLQEAQAFWPLYNELWGRRDKLFAERRALIRRAGNSSLDGKTSAQVSQLLLDNMQEDVKLSEEYHQKFSTVLSAQKLLQYYVAEETFKLELLNGLRKPDKP